LEERLTKVDEIDELVSDWVSNLTTEEAVELLDNAGIPNGPVLKMTEVVELPIVKERELVVQLEDKDGDKMYGPGSPIKLSRTPVSINRSAPLPGQHNEEVLSNLLNLSNAYIASLKEKKVI
jgi:crotonobetainyl-CoA:carnitine CoA-transferase CaiB-like acyl-CoA transferase